MEMAVPPGESLRADLEHRAQPPMDTGHFGSSTGSRERTAERTGRGGRQEAPEPSGQGDAFVGRCALVALLVFSFPSKRCISSPRPFPRSRSTVALAEEQVWKDVKPTSRCLRFWRVLLRKRRAMTSALGCHWKTRCLKHGSTFQTMQVISASAPFSLVVIKSQIALGPFPL